MMPVFTYKTMVTPKVGPPNNGIRYGAEKDLNRMAQPFNPAIPADPMMGILPEILRRNPAAQRTLHPILSFTGINTEAILAAQSHLEPLAPIGALAEAGGWVVLINVGHDVNTSIHHAEKLAGRRQFIRWALTEDRILECPGFPGDSTGFTAIENPILPHTRHVQMDRNTFVQAVPLKRLFIIVVELIKKDPLALLCQRTDCERCNAVRGI
jgi:aminoglycoside 3-N-acetyltransferase